MSRYKYLKLKYVGNIDGYKCYHNVLKALGISNNFIWLKNFHYFGVKKIYNQNIIEKKFEIIENDFNDLLNEICIKYACETVLLEFGTIFNKLQIIRLENDELLKNLEYNLPKIEEFDYSAKVADLMARKLKTCIEICISRNNSNGKNYFCNKDYKNFIMLLYYFSVSKFYKVKSNLSNNYENGEVEFYILPSSLTAIYNAIPNQKNSINANHIYYNYDSGLRDSTIANSIFLNEFGVSFDNFINLLNDLIKNMDFKNIINSKINKDEFMRILVENNYILNKQKFKKNCILTNQKLCNENVLYKNNGKYRLDTTPFIDIGKDYYILNRAVLFNSQNYWKNVFYIGMKPYIGEKDDKILLAVDGVIRKITKQLERDTIEILKKVNNNFKIYYNKKTKDIFNDKNISDNEWDIIAVDNKKKYIFDIEVKFLSTSMTESSLANDLKKIDEDSIKSYKNKFEKRIIIEEENKFDFLDFCNADNDYKIIRIMVISKVVDLNIKSETRKFLIIHYEGFEKFLKDNYYKKHP